ncbi:MAG TPA: DUF4188 domain-containing protein [Myxococcota bacterium]|nr:DUF4188 domain-containing protein [Myxococcota bacterium]
MKTSVQRETVDLSSYPDLVVIYLGMRAQSLRGLRTLFSFGPRIRASVDAAPDGLLHHETFVFSLLPPHFAFRQYWRDFESLERFTRASPHGEWWRGYLRDTGGTGFWHEAYSARGGFEAVYVDVAVPVGMKQFAPVVPPRGSMFTARHRLRRRGGETAPPVLAERELYGSE